MLRIAVLDDEQEYINRIKLITEQYMSKLEYKLQCFC